MAAGTKPPPAKVAKPAKDDPAKLALARQQYAQAGALPGTPAAAYLQKRGLGHTDAWDRLRASVLWHPMRGPCPVLIASIDGPDGRSEEHTSELQSLMRIPYAVFCLKKK